MTNPETLIEPVDTGLTPADHEQALAAYEAFLRLPQPVKDQFFFPGIEGRERNTRAGYVLKTAKDQKEVFHFTPKFLEFVNDEGIDLPGEARELFAVSRETYSLVLRGVKRVLDERSPLLRPVHFPPSAPLNHHLRFVNYLNTKPGDVLAAGHYDQSTFTVALCETDPGLRLGTGPADIEAYQRDPNQSVLFSGLGSLNLHRYLGLGADFLPTWHEVVMPERTTQTQIGRSAIILFLNPAYLDTTPTEEDTKTPLSEETIGGLLAEGVIASSRSMAA